MAFHRFVDLDIVGSEAAFEAAASGQPTIQGIGDKAASFDGGVAFLIHGKNVSLSVTLHQTGDEDPATMSQEQSEAQLLAKLAAGRL